MEIRKARLPRLAVLVGALWFTGGPGHAVDHNNMDAGRPLSFDDAEAIAYRERALELGGSVLSPNGKRAGGELAVEFLYGFALNSHGSLDFDPSWGGRAGSDEERFDVGRLGLGLFHNINRELARLPAFAVRGDIFLPTGRATRGADLRLRAIFSKALIQYDRIHVNVDGNIVSDPDEGERAFRPDLIVGYSRPLGYPRVFNRTGVAEVALRSGERTGQGPVIGLGLGLRQQITVRSVVDIGVRSDVLGARQASRDDVRITVGYSIGF